MIEIENHFKLISFKRGQIEFDLTPDARPQLVLEMAKVLARNSQLQWKFIRTTDEKHAQSSQAIWKAIEGNGDIYLGSYSGWYSIHHSSIQAEFNSIIVVVILGVGQLVAFSYTLTFFLDIVFITK